MIERPKFAFLFEGQGQQHPGMWRDLYNVSPEAARIFDRADQLAKKEGLPFRITDACFVLENNILTGEKPSPVAIQLSNLTGETATIAYLHANNVPRATANAGHSLGQIAAGIESEFWSFDTAFRATVVRSSAMERVAAAIEMTVCVVSDTRKEAGNLIAETTKALSELGDSGINTMITVINHRRQLVTTGPPEELERFKESMAKIDPRIKLRNYPLPFSHHPKMLKAQEEWNKELDILKGKFNQTVEAGVNHLSDVKDWIISGADSFRRSLGVQLIRPDWWNLNWARLKYLKIEIGVEIGPGAIFPKMAKVDYPELEVLTTPTLDAMDIVISKLALPSKTYSIPN